MVPLPSTKEMKRACSEALLRKDVFSNNSPFVKVEKIETHKERSNVLLLLQTREKNPKWYQSGRPSSSAVEKVQEITTWG